MFIFLNETCKMCFKFSYINMQVQIMVINLHFRCCLHVSQLEHRFFSSNSSQSSGISLTKVNNKTTNSSNSLDKMTTADRLQFSFTPEDDDEVW